MNADHPAPHPGGRPEDGASYWDARLRNPNCTQAERAQFEAWRADPANAAAFERLQMMLETLRAGASRPALRVIRDAALQWRTPRLIWATGLAAVLVLGLSAYVGLRAGVVQQAANASSAHSADNRPQVYATAIGERRTVALEDGSTVTLNTQSRIETHFTEGRRNLTLVAGQALFEVAHEAERPFVVTAGDRQVTALGTQFDVRLEQSRVRVVLVEGRVAIERRQVEGLNLFHLTNRRELRPGQAFDSAARVQAIVQIADVNQATLWREGRVSFTDAPLPEAVAEINRYSTGALILTDPSMARLRINGVFRTNEPETFVSALEAYFPVEAREQPSGDMLLVWRR